MVSDDITTQIITKEGKRFVLDPLTAEDLRRAFEPYGSQLGYVVFSWNNLHDNLSNLFRVIVKSETMDLALAVWHSTDNDFTQRKMLRAALDAAEHTPISQRKDMVWILDQIDNSLRHGRNDAIHAPLMYARGIVNSALSLWITANAFSASPRAKALRGKDLLAEFKELTALADLLSDYVQKILLSLSSPNIHSWPQKPKLPHAHRTKNRKESSSQNNAK